MGSISTRAAAVIASVFVGLIGATGAARAGGSGAALFGPAYASTKVIKNGERHTLVDGTRIRVKFVREDDRDLARWRSGCNDVGGPVEITPRRLEIAQIAGTDVGCARPVLRQEAWVDGFFGSDPRWARHGRRLRLRSGDDLIVFRRSA